MNIIWKGVGDPRRFAGWTAKGEEQRKGAEKEEGKTVLQFHSVVFSNNQAVESSSVQRKENLKPKQML